MSRNRPRLNITLDPELKKRLKEIAGELEVPVSRLLEEILSDFVSQLDREENLKSNLKEAIESDEPTDRESLSEAEARREITDLLEELEP